MSGDFDELMAEKAVFYGILDENDEMSHLHLKKIEGTIGRIFSSDYYRYASDRGFSYNSKLFEKEYYGLMANFADDYMKALSGNGDLSISSVSYPLTENGSENRKIVADVIKEIKYDKELDIEFIEYAARYVFADAWGNWVEENGTQSLSGVDLYRDCPEPTSSALEWAAKLEGRYEALFGQKIKDVYLEAIKFCHYVDNLEDEVNNLQGKDSYEHFSCMLAASACGMGVSWGDDHPVTKEFEIVTRNIYSPYDDPYDGPEPEVGDEEAIGNFKI